MIKIKYKSILILCSILLIENRIYAQCDNFENNSLSGWTIQSYNRVNSSLTANQPTITGNSCIHKVVNFPPNAVAHINNIDTTRYFWGITDLVSDTMFKCIINSNFIMLGSKYLKLGRESYAEAGIESVKKTYNTTIANSKLYFNYAFIMQEPSLTHTASNLPFFGVKINGVYTPINHTNPTFTPTQPTTPIFSVDDGYSIISTNGYKARPWVCASINLPVGQNEVEFLIGDCAYGGHWGYVLLDNICNNQSITCINNAYVSNVSGVSCNRTFNGVILHDISGATITDVKVSLYRDGVKKLTSSSLKSFYNPTTKKIIVPDIESYFPYLMPNYFDLVIEVYGSSGLLYSSNMYGNKCMSNYTEEDKFGCISRAKLQNVSLTKDSCGNFNVMGIFPRTVFSKGLPSPVTANFLGFKASVANTNVELSIPQYYNSSTGAFSIPLGIFENQIPEGVFYDLNLKLIESSPVDVFETVGNLDGIVSDYNNDFYVKNNRILISDSTIINSNRCSVKIKYKYDSFSNYTDFNYVRDESKDYSTLCDSILAYKIIETPNKEDNCYCKFNFKRFVDSFQFGTKIPVIPCYNLVSLDSSYKCATDDLKLDFIYKLNQQYNGQDLYVYISIFSDCDLYKCETFMCKSNTGTVLNPFLNNIKGNIRPQEEKLYITKREVNPTLSIRKGETYTSFVPLYSFNTTSGKWDISTSNKWITKDFVTNYDIKGNQIETKDPLNIYTAYKFGYNKSMVSAVAKNAKYKECINLSFEDEYFNVDPSKNYSDGYKREFYLPKIGMGNPNSNSLNSFDEVNNIAYADVVDNVGHTGTFSYFVKPFFGTISASLFKDKEPYLMKVTPLCGPSDPNYLEPTYEVADSTIKTVDNSYNPAFALEKGKKYLISYWVKDESLNINQFATYFDRGYIDINYDCNAPTVVKTNLNKGKSIEGWRQESYEFVIPTTANLFKMVFMPNSNGTYFDDIRIYPSDGNMKAYVYDPINLRFTAELDENNFATFYDYDEQGQLIRVRKETDRGIMTIKEHRTSLKQE